MEKYMIGMCFVVLVGFLPQCIFKDSSDQQLYERVYSLFKKDFVEIPGIWELKWLTREEGEKRWHVSGRICIYSGN